MLEIEKLRLPVEPSALPERAWRGWAPVIAGRQDHEVVRLLKERWSTFQIPYLQKLSAAILSRELKCLSIDSTGRQWLTFEDESSPLHVAPRAALSATLRSRFPFDRIPGLADFLENFGGLANWSLPPCPWFLPADECRVVASDCDVYDWGLIGNWGGSLPLYCTRGGNVIVVSPDNRCAKWDHDVGWECDDEDPFESLNWTVSTLVEEFIAYLSLEDDKAMDSPFYY